MDRRLNQPASREQIVAIMRQLQQRAEIIHHIVPNLPAGLDVGGAERAWHRDQLFPRPPEPLLDEEAGLLLGRRLAGGGPRGARGGQFFRQASLFDDEDPLEATAPSGKMPLNPAKLTHVQRIGDAVHYAGPRADPEGLVPSPPGTWVSGSPCRVDSGDSFSFSLQVSYEPQNDRRAKCGIIVGLVSGDHPPGVPPGMHPGSYGLCVGDGSIFHERPRSQAFSAYIFKPGDKIGCEIRPSSKSQHYSHHIVFYANGKKLGFPVPVRLPEDGMYPAFSLTKAGERVKLLGDLARAPEKEADMMLVDGSEEEEWVRLHDIRLSGNVLEYTGRGSGDYDVGLAQAKTPISTRNHYYEIEIVDPGKKCYIAIGLARKGYPKRRHPGWKKGSIAYHADDGKVFMGSGKGAPLGPTCHKGDIMGCGILFPRNYESKSDSEEELEQQQRAFSDGGGGRQGDPEDRLAMLLGHRGDRALDLGLDEIASDSGEEEEWWPDQSLVQTGVKVQVYFTRNGKVVGRKDVKIPKGGFYPTIGMMSCQEKVRVDLRPLSG